MSKRAFEYQAPTPEHIQAIQAVRDACAGLEAVINNNVPSCAERTLAIRALEQCSMWSNKAIVFDGERYIP